MRALTDGKRRAKQVRAFPIFVEAAQIIGMKPEDLKKEVQQGKSILDVAKTKGVTEETLHSKIVANRSAKLDEAVKAGKLTAEQAAKMKSKMSEHVKFMLNKKGLSEHHGHHHRLISPEKLAPILGLTKDELMQQLKSGKSLAEIASAKGMTREQLVDKIKEELTPMIERSIDMKYKKEE